MTYLAKRIQQFGTTIFTEMTNLANEHQAVNLGQGFPDFAGPAFLKQAAAEAIAADVNQYAPVNGRSGLREAVARSMTRHYDMTVDPHTEVMITHGATEALFAAIQGLVDSGDEVIVFEPFYDSYIPAIEMAGGMPRYYTLRPPDWQIDQAALADLFSAKTKLIMINTPHNPTGKVFTKAELMFIADLCQQHDVIALTDEVYEHIIFDDERHVLLASLPGMVERTVTVSSAGKTFSVTGWKVGWVVAKPALITAVQRSSQFIIFCGAAPLQEAVITGLNAPDDYYQELRAMYQGNRDFLMDALQEVGLEPILPKGSYFIMAEIGHLDFANDVEFCRYLTTNVGVTPVPPSPFYHDPADGATLARFAFCKKRETLAEAVDRLRKKLHP